LVPYILLALYARTDEVSFVEARLNMNTDETLREVNLRQTITDVMEIPIEVVAKIIDSFPFEILWKHCETAA
jgi:hypothetical protein